jgi:hypothetical protein
VEAHPDAFGDRRDTNVEVEHQTYVNLEMPFGRRICRGVEMKNLLARNEHKINMATVSVLTNILRDGSIQRRGSLKAGWMDGSLSLYSTGRKCCTNGGACFCGVGGQKPAD